MTFLRSVGLILVAILLIAIAGAWWYFFGPNTVSAARLVPADTLVFASVPNAAAIGAGYETSQLKKLIESPNAQPAFDHLARTFGPKNLALLQVFLPNLSGQSFVALTHLDPSKPEETGFVAGMKPKPGLDNFDSFVQQANAAYPDLLRETKTGKGNLLGVDYQWIQGANSPGRICVARYHGWIVTAWGEASLQDWLERMQGKSATPSLADNADYQKSIGRVGKDSQAFLYTDYRALLGPWIQRFADAPGQADYLTKKIANIGGLAIGSRFEGGDILDRFSLLEPRQAQLDSGISATPCPFDTLKFTGPNTRFYFGANVNWTQIWKNFQEQSAVSSPIKALMDDVNSWAQDEKLDVQKNLIGPLGSEYSVQLEWDTDSMYPDLGVYLKVDKQDDFKPTIAALIDTVRKQFSTSAVITEISASGHTYATLKTVRPMPVAPTMTEDGPYFGLFLNEQHAVRSFTRDESSGLLHNDDFNRQIGDKRQGASELVYFDSPAFLDHAYRTALPFVSMGAMFNPTLASLLKDRQLPPDLSWLAPIGSWSAVVSMDDDGVTGYSTSGIGNQGIFLASGLGGSAFALAAGFTPWHHHTEVTTPAGSPLLPPGTLGNPTVPPAVAPPPGAADAVTNAMPEVTNPAPAATDTMSPGTNAAPSTNSDVNPVTPVIPPDTAH